MKAKFVNLFFAAVAVIFLSACNDLPSRDDTEPPVITLKGDSNITFSSENEYADYKDPGATAWDNVDGNLTNKIETYTTSSISLDSKYTVYTFTYKVTDNAGNQATPVKRTIKVWLKQEVVRKCTIGDDKLSISLKKSDDNTSATFDITQGGKSIISDGSTLFELQSDAGNYSSSDRWDSIEITCDAERMKIVFEGNKTKVTADLKAKDGRSEWSYSVDIDENKSILSLNAPHLVFDKIDNDKLFYPAKLGKLSTDPTSRPKPFKVEGEEYDELTYPTGLAMSMQYMAYYGTDMGIYIGYHDPKASIKTYHAVGNDGKLDFFIQTPAPNATIAGNDFNMSGHIELDIFHGDWYDAAQIYKRWVLSKAEYRPMMDQGNRAAIQNNLSQIGVWGSITGEEAIGQLDLFADMFEHSKVGMVVNHWGDFGNSGCGGDWDCGYPNYFPAREGFANAISQHKAKVYFMPYINGRIYDKNRNGATNDAEFSSQIGNPMHYLNFASFAPQNAIKLNKKGEADRYSYFGDYLVVMNPKSTQWQDLISTTAKRVFSILGSQGIYIDQVGRSSALMCMEEDGCHGEIGGGHQWREGYAAMFDQVRSKSASVVTNAFVTVEGNSDYIIDKVDNYNVMLTFAERNIPAFQAVYSGKVQFGSVEHSTANYKNDTFYMKFAQAFVRGVVPGRFDVWFSKDPNAFAARLFVKNLAQIRYDYRDYLALGSMQRIPKVEIIEGNQTVHSDDWNKDDVVEPVDIASVQGGAYCSKEKKTLGLFFVNATMDQDVKFRFTIPKNECGAQEGKVVEAYLRGREAAVYTIRGEQGSFEVKPTHDDTTKPVITLSGSASITIETGAEYSDAGATANDNVDGNITAKIVTTGAWIDTSKEGNYTVTYNVMDAAGNIADEVRRTVRVIAPRESLTITTGKESYTPNSIVEVIIGGKLSGDKDWAGVYPKDAGNDWGNVIAWNWVGQGNNTLNKDVKDMPAGEYEVRLFFHNSTDSEEAKSAFTVKVEHNEYGQKGTHKVSTYSEKDEGNSIVYYPSDISRDHKTPLIFFCPGWNSNEPAGYDVLLRFIASHGYSVIYAKDYYGDIDTFIERFEKMLDDKNDVLPYVDTTRIGVIGHSSGGGDTFAVLKHFSDKGYGKNGRFLMSLDGWFAFGMNSDAMRHLPANTNVVMQRYSQPDRAPKNGQDPRITWSEYALLDSIPADHKDYQVYSPATHSYMKQDSIEKMQGLLRPLDALMQYTFEGKEAARDIALENGNDAPWENGYEEFVEPWKYDFRCDSHTNRAEVMEIDYCHQYAGGKRYPADITVFDNKPIADVEKPGYLESYVDPEFGNRVTRITDRANQTGNAHNYPKTQSWNADMSLIRLGYRLYNADSFTESELTVNQHLRGSLTEMKWSSYEPDVFYGIDVRNDRFVFMKAKINREDNTISYTDMPNATFMKSEYDELKLGKYEGNLDYQDNYVVLAGRKKGTNRVTLIVYHLKDNFGKDYNKVEAIKTMDLKWYVEQNDGSFVVNSKQSNQMFDWASISALGNYVIVNYRSKKGDDDQEYTIEQYYRNLTHVRTLAKFAAHGDLGVDANGREVFVQFGFGDLDGADNRGIWMHPLDGSPKVRLLPDKYNGGHVSCRNYKRPGWCYINTSAAQNGSGVREAFALKLDNSHTVERFAQTHSSKKNVEEVQVGVSPDGTQILFASDWGNEDGVIDTYHVKVGQ